MHHGLCYCCCSHVLPCSSEEGSLDFDFSFWFDACASRRCQCEQQNAPSCTLSLARTNTWWRLECWMNTIAWTIIHRQTDSFVMKKNNQSSICIKKKVLQHVSRIKYECEKTRSGFKRTCNFQLFPIIKGFLNKSDLNKLQNDRILLTWIYAQTCTTNIMLSYNTAACTRILPSPPPPSMRTTGMMRPDVHANNAVFPPVSFRSADCTQTGTRSTHACGEGACRVSCCAAQLVLACLLSFVRFGRLVVFVGSTVFLPSYRSVVSWTLYIKYVRGFCFILNACVGASYSRFACSLAGWLMPNTPHAPVKCARAHA